MPTTWVVLVLLSLVTVVCCEKNYSRELVRNMTRDFPCVEPQRRAYRVTEFTSDAKMFNQPFVVLHRCERAGCCTTKRPKCTAIEKEKVTFSISYQDLDTGTLKEFRFSTENHTKCECQGSVKIK